jgi:hypothetical protein
MRAKLRLGSLLFLALIPFSTFAQELTLTTTSANVISSKASIDMPGLSGNPLAIIVATPLGDTEQRNPHPIGAWYYSGKWNIFNSDHAAMPLGLKYKVQFFLNPGPNQFLHLITEQNLGSEGSYIDNPALNNNPTAQFKILQNHAPDNRSGYNLNRFEARAGYGSAAGRWYIANVSGEPLRKGSAYNVVITSGQGKGAKAPIPAAAATAASPTSAEPAIYLIVPPLKPGDIGPPVRNLIAALLWLVERKVISPLDAPYRPTREELETITGAARNEMATSTFGEATKFLVNYFQVQQGLGDGLGGQVEGSTAAKLNELLKRLGAIGASRPTRNDHWQLDWNDAAHRTDPRLSKRSNRTR